MKCNKELTKNLRLGETFGTATQACQNECLGGQDMCMVHIELKELEERIRKIELSLQE